MQLDVRIQPVDAATPHVRVLAIEGELDQTSTAVLHRGAQDMMAASGATVAILDLTKLAYINSYGVGSLLALDMHLQRTRKRMILVGAQGIVLDVLTLVGLPQILPCYATIEEAVDALRAHDASVHA